MKIKKVLFAMSMIAVMAAGAMAVSAFSTAKQNTAQVGMNDDWYKFRKNVPYCDADKDVCMGYGTVWVDRENYQVAFEDDKTSNKYDLSEYTGKQGYNMRFWRSSDKKYYYVNIFIPRSAFE